mmetsp:Transcript_8850/g.7830  ORF Transcript_8850/g.7830 Transcript_8850/m.7830 type:complete len:144 (+) Transcript_8850:79-510(+)
MNNRFSRFQNNSSSSENDAFVENAAKDPGYQCCHLIILVIILFFSEANCGDDVRSLITSILWMKVGIIFIEIILFGCIGGGVIGSKGFTVIATAARIYCLTWYWQVITQFFSSDNNCWEKNGWIWFSLFVLLLDAFMNFIGMI